MDHNGFEVLYTDYNVQLFLHLESGKVACVDNYRRPHGLLQDLYVTQVSATLFYDG